MKFGLHLRQRQTLVMTPKLQQALKLLQMPSIELQQMLKQEIMENPLLEEIEEYEEITEENEEKEASDGDGKDEPSESSQEEADSKPDGGEAGEEQVDWDEYFNAGFELGRAGGEEEQQEEFFEKVPVAKQSFTDQLMGQLRIATDEPATLMIGDYIIGSLDESGYLTCTIEEIAHTFDVNLEEVDRVLELIQSFDPPGVGARNLQECLLLQLRFRGEDDSLAAIIIRSHFDEFKQKKYMEIARKLKVSVQDIQDQCKQIATLDPKPGLEVVVEDPKYVIPDLVVETVDGKYVVYLNDRNVPRLRVSQHYHDELMREVRNGDNEAREFINARLKSAKWLIQTIEQRRRTMVKVMECIVRKQREFFDKGTAFLKPLTLQQVASEIGMHESTVSRVTTNKYVQTPRGVFELKFFFSSSLSTQDGGEVSAKSAKDHIRRIIEAESARTPLSDQKIADMLKKDGLNIARRTVAKYREQLNILPARMRKQY
ncbi:MAG: RNA polymerase factor sigma-54 [Candidatus Krumholzibacteria bacterium]|nr:RNA polymerase factor sigma-54 [Candidatus Krumholzibacteria bacterium]MDH4336513.1 RNA polymerase factor sigma-54 [Candidatus Krumholzibacteria bacterium]MDH5269594.1 RNA polymerase factor sigma-54 [Candidatus Krumholzibacteria bacterium]